MAAGEVTVTGSKGSAERFQTLKNKIDTEVRKRCLNNMDTANSIDFGSLRTLTGDMEFSTPVETGAVIMAEHGQKSINFLYEIQDLEGIDWVVRHGLLPSKQEILSLDDFMAILSGETMEGTSSSCRGACTGLCFGSCIGGCNGCTNACTGECSGCTATCGTGCASGSMTA